MTTPDITKRSATELIADVRAGKLKASDIARAYLDTIAAREPDVQAFAYFNASAVEEQAAALDAKQAAGERLGPLHGLPVGIKDIIDTGDMPTEHGSRYFKDNQPERDATCVAQLRAAGAIIIGKTVTTELATRHPGKTRNPHNPAHTPGGSSSGSGAGVAADMMPLALGTQTGGSVIRPASFNGVHGLKPTRGLISRTGVLMQSHTLDTIGVYGKSLDDIALITSVLDQYDPTDDVSYVRPHCQLMPTAEAATLASDVPRIGFFKTPAWDSADASAREAIEAFAANLGAACEEVQLPDAFNAIGKYQKTVQHGENQYHYGPLFDRDPGLASEALAAILGGERITARDYQLALMQREPLYAMLADTLDRYDALIALSSTGPAPEGHSWTGDPVFNALWTYLGVPTVSLPKLTVGGLPCGVTVVGKRRGEAKLLAVSDWIEKTGAPVSV
jgi:Asp-tRNA(Asn)/Glu-tRNA(Gln) amidotransferase A subunit family amidase